MINKSKLKLFVWEDFNSDYTRTPGLAFAIAPNKDEAKKIIIKKIGYDPGEGNWGDLLQVKSLNKKLGFARSGGGG